MSSLEARDLLSVGLAASDESARAAQSVASVPMERNRIGALDGLRGIAIGMILVHHTVTSALPASRLKDMLNLLWSGVDLFLVLSGFLIGAILIKNRSSPKLFSVFYSRRALRILPLYYLTLALIFFKLPPHTGDWAPAWVYFSFVSNIWIAVTNHWQFLPLGITWSLAVEEQFYLVAPLVCYFTPRKYLGWAIGFGCVVPWIGRGLLFSLAPKTWWFSGHLLTPFRADSFAFGMLLAWALGAPEGQSLLAFLTRHWRALLGITGLGVAAFILRDTHEASPDALLYGYTALASFWAMIILVLLIVRPPVLEGITNLSALRHLGRHAYFIYLWHGIVIIVLQAHLAKWGIATTSGNLLLLTVIEIGITWGLAALSWKLFEGPLVKLGHRLAY